MRTMLIEHVGSRKTPNPFIHRLKFLLLHHVMAALRAHTLFERDVITL